MDSSKNTTINMSPRSYDRFIQNFAYVLPYIRLYVNDSLWENDSDSKETGGVQKYCKIKQFSNKK